MSETISLNDFLKLSKTTPVIDVRSPGEYQHAHIPGAINLPLLDNDNRKEVGITYKNFGREKAVQKGFDLVGDKFGAKIREAEKISPKKEILIYCWRGGMRSGVIGWILRMTGFKTFLLKDGYKSYRNWVLKTLQQPKNICIIGGKTGTGKTEILKQLRKLNEQIIDLEFLANHKGSAFGGLGQLPQAKNEYFENQLAMQWSEANDEKILWLENESRAIGNLKIPDTIFEMMRIAPVIEIEIPFELRVKNILKEYAVFPKEQLIENTEKLQKRLGIPRMREAIQCLLNDDFEKWTIMMLEYYDKFYSFGMEQREKSKIFKLKFSHNDYSQIAKEVKDFTEKTLANKINFAEKIH